ncbi:MAG: hypothetical protein LBF68_05700, partial [Christensenellaceae bacterium]|nr:hypothetical protein [Christensenellaceae bacterium]
MLNVLENILQNEYNRDNLNKLMEFLFEDYSIEYPAEEYEHHSKLFSTVHKLGVAKEIDDLHVFEVILLDDADNKQIKITQDMFRLLDNHVIT